MHRPAEGELAAALEGLWRRLEDGEAWRPVLGLARRLNQREAVLPYLRRKVKEDSQRARELLGAAEGVRDLGEQLLDRGLEGERREISTHAGLTRWTWDHRGSGVLLHYQDLYELRRAPDFGPEPLFTFPGVPSGPGKLDVDAAEGLLWAAWTWSPSRPMIDLRPSFLARSAPPELRFARYRVPGAGDRPTVELPEEALRHFGVSHAGRAAAVTGKATGTLVDLARGWVVPGSGQACRLARLEEAGWLKKSLVLEPIRALEGAPPEQPPAPGPPRTFLASSGRDALLLDDLPTGERRAVRLELGDPPRATGVARFSPPLAPGGSLLATHSPHSRAFVLLETDQRHAASIQLLEGDEGELEWRELTRLDGRFPQLALLDGGRLLALANRSDGERPSTTLLDLRAGRILGDFRCEIRPFPWEPLELDGGLVASRTGQPRGPGRHRSGLPLTPWDHLLFWPV